MLHKFDSSARTGVMGKKAKTTKTLITWVEYSLATAADGIKALTHYRYEADEAIICGRLLVIGLTLLTAAFEMMAQKGTTHETSTAAEEAPLSSAVYLTVI